MWPVFRYLRQLLEWSWSGQHPHWCLSTRGLWPPTKTWPEDTPLCVAVLYRRSLRDKKKKSLQIRRTETVRFRSRRHSLDSILVTAGAVLTSARTSYVAEWTRRSTAEFCRESHTPIPDTTRLVIDRFESPPITNECWKREMRLKTNTHTCIIFIVHVWIALTTRHYIVDSSQPISMRKII